jgi:hypothetical protein
MELALNAWPPLIRAEAINMDWNVDGAMAGSR